MKNENAKLIFFQLQINENPHVCDFRATNSQLFRYMKSAYPRFVYFCGVNNQLKTIWNKK